MKRILAFVLALVMTVSCLFALSACGEDYAADLKAGKEYIELTYKDTKITGSDYTLPKSIPVNGKTYEVEWSVNVTAGVTIEVGEKNVTVKVDSKTSTKIDYKLTATLKAPNGDTVSVTFDRTVPAYKSQEDIVNEAYALGNNESMSEPRTLTGTITSISGVYLDLDGAITLVMQIGDLADKPITAFKAKGEGFDKLAVGDTITITGTLKNYYQEASGTKPAKNTIEFDSGCTIDSYEIKGEVPTYANDAAIVDAAYALASGAALRGVVTLTGVIASVDTAYSIQYKNVTVTMNVPGTTGKPIIAYRLTGVGCDTMKVGDTITVKGLLMNYNGKYEFTSGCICTNVVDGGGVTPEPTPGLTTPDEIVNAAYALGKNESLDRPYTLTGVITKIDAAYDSSYKNVSVVIVVGTMTDKPILCYRMKGTGADKIKVGDTITVTGTLTNFWQEASEDGTKPERSIVEFKAGCTLDSYTPAGGENPDPKPNPNPGELEHAGTADDPYTVADARTATAALADKTFPDGKVFVKGVVKSITYNSKYSNWKITIVDEGGTDEFIVYGATFADGITVVSENDTIVATGYLYNYSGTYEFSGDSTHDYPTVTALTAGTSTISVSSKSSADATVTLSANTGLNGSTFTFTVAVADGKQIVTVKVNGEIVTAVDGVYTATVAGNTTVFAETSDAGAKIPTLAGSITFDDVKKRTSVSTDQQVWEENSIKVTNNKSSSSSNVNEKYYAPIRIYKGSNLTVEYTGMTKIVFHLNSAKPVEGLTGALPAGANVVVDGYTVTVTFSEAVNSFAVGDATAQYQLDSIDVYTTAA